MHDMGLIAATRTENGEEERGFEVYVGGGLGRSSLSGQAVRLVRSARRSCCRWPGHRARLRAGSARRRIAAARALSSWCRISASRNSRNWCSKSARPCRTIRAGRITLRTPSEFKEAPLRPAGESRRACRKVSSAGARRNTRAQKQPGYVGRHRRAAARRHYRRPACARWRTSPAASRKETIRTTVEQNFVIRWVSNGDLPDIYDALERRGIGRRGRRQPSPTSSPAPARTPASWASPRRAGWRPSCARAARR